jgi:hypothetical protein
LITGALRNADDIQAFLQCWETDRPPMVVWTWIVRLVLPMLLGVLVAALHVMWTESPYAPGVLDILGTIGIAVAMLGIVVWCICAWLGCEELGSAPPFGQPPFD